MGLDCGLYDFYSAVVSDDLFVYQESGSWFCLAEGVCLFDFFLDSGVDSGFGFFCELGIRRIVFVGVSLYFSVGI